MQVQSKGFSSRKAARRRAGDPSDSTLNRWIEAGFFPAPVKIGPQRVGFRNSELENAWGWIKKDVSEEIS